MASITQLYIFHKNTDATYTERGFEYQKLKTIEAWISNTIDNNNEVIYYDYQDDIFHRDISQLKSKFRQIKLYSSNFSFTSNEINKAIIHFFTLFTHSDYLLDDVKFVFETNSSIANKYKDNDAELLKDWYNNQNDLKGNILDRCVQKSKQIVSGYIDNFDSNTVELKKAKDVFLQVSNNKEFWENFVKSIQWKFEGIKPELAMSQCLKSIENLASKLPYDLEKHHIQNLIHTLHFHISQSATKENSIDRLLTNIVLEKYIFEAIGGDEKNYIQALNDIREETDINQFIIGKLYQIITWSRFYRQHKNIKGHKEIWTKVLISYLEYPEIPEFCQKDILYELIFLKLRPTLEFKFKEPNGNNIEEYAEQLFSIIPTKINDPNSIEDAVTAFSILRTASLQKIIKINKKSFIKWYHLLDLCLQKKINTENINLKCNYLETYSFLQITIKYQTAKNKKAVINESIKIIEQILEFSSTANLYNYTNLYERIDGVISGLIKIDYKDTHKIIENLNELSDKLIPIIEEREGKYQTAVKYRKKGLLFFKSARNNRKFILKSIEYLHKAKLLLFQDETREGFMLTLLNISQIYNSIGYNFAAKYYALAAFYVGISDNDYFEKIVTSIGLIHHIDFKQGAWINCMMDFERFVTYNGELIDDWNYETNKPLNEIVLDFSFLLFLTPKITNRLNILITQELKKYKALSNDYIGFVIEQFKLTYPTDIDTNKILQKKLNDMPYNDVGKKRKIQFNSHDFLWIIKFSNDYNTNVYGEEFLAILQILLIELETKYEYKYKSDIKNVHIELHLSSSLLPPKKIKVSEENVFFDIYLPNIENVKIYYPNVLTIISHILQFLSVEQNVTDLVLDLEKEHNLGAKATVVQAYKTLYKSLFSEDNYNVFRRDFFEKIIF